MGLSKVYTVEKFWSDAVLDVVGEFGVADDQIQVIFLERFDLINRRVVDVIAGEFYSILARDYFRPEEIEITEDDDPAIVDLEDLRMMKVGQPMKMELVSDALSTKLAKPVSLQQLQVWNPSSVFNKSSIVYHYAGNKLYARKGASLTQDWSGISLELWYPSIPEDVSDNEDAIDVPDGAAMEVALIRLKIVIAERMNLGKSERYKAELQRLIAELYANYGVTASAEQQRQKLQAVS